MWWLFGNVILEFLYFVIVDGIAKTPLREARSEEEKRIIWLYESVFLSIVCVVIHLLDHCPYVLVTLTLVTAVYTQLCKNVNISNMWHKFKEHWEVHVHHSDNVKNINERRKQIELWHKHSMQQPPVSKPVMSRLSDFICRRNEKKPAFNSAQPSQQLTVGDLFSKPVKLFREQPSMTTEPMISQPSTSQQTALSSQVPVFSQPSSVSPVSDVQPPLPRPTLTQPQQTFLPLTQTMQSVEKRRTNEVHISQMATSPVRKVNNWFLNTDLRRRPLRNYEQKDMSQVSFRSTQSSLKNKFMSAFGFSSEDNKRPPGLRNEGLNLCFMNCVIQCLAHTPDLVDKIIFSANQELDCSEAEIVMVDSLIDIMAQCKKTNNKVGGSDGVLDPTILRETMSVLNGGLVAPPTERQRQQDAAEFFMWLMETLHKTLKKTSDQESHPKGGSLETLEFIYKDLSEHRVEELKKACRAEISQANGLQNDTYAEAIQRLSDLEWLTYKQKNHSVVDDVFTGQLVEAYQCLAGNHLTVNMQTFNILPVPITRSYTGLVSLQDCFAKFCNVEHLVGPEGLECVQCKKNMYTPNTISSASSGLVNHRKPSSRTKRSKVYSYLQSVDSAFQSSVMSPTYMSPIQGQTEAMNDSGFQDNVFRTSTPVGERSRQFFPSRPLHETERRCLLRQLPECLVIQPMRFAYDPFTQQCRKIHEQISIPLKGLDLTAIVYDNVTNREDLTSGQQQHKYDLYAVCSHLGAESTSYGHYVCYCLAQNGIWYMFDDEMVTEVNMEYEITSKEIRENAYLLFYKRVPIQI